jgi:hypothetical protein
MTVPESPDHSSVVVASRGMPPRILPFAASKIQPVPPARSFRRPSPPRVHDEKESKSYINDDRLTLTTTPIVPITATAVTGTVTTAVAVGKPTGNLHPSLCVISLLSCDL